MSNTTPYTFRAMAYAFGHRCQVVNGSSHEGEIIAMSRDGARIRLKSASALDSLPRGHECTLRPNIMLENGPLNDFTCVVNWIDGAEMGLTFQTACTIGMAALQGGMATGANSPRKEE